MTDRQTPIGEEPWEADVSAMLGALPAVEPPPGFFEAAIDHRPLYAGRTLVGLVVAAIVAVGALVVVRLVDDGAGVPQLDIFTERHLEARADVGSDTARADSGVGAAARVDVAPYLPEGYTSVGVVGGDGVGHAMYHRASDTISVFIEDGHVDWAALPGEGAMHIVAGADAWVDVDRGLSVIEVDGATVTIVGLAAEDFAALGIDGSGGLGAETTRGPVARLLTDAARQLGLPG